MIKRISILAIAASLAGLATWLITADNSKVELSLNSADDNTIAVQTERLSKEVSLAEGMFNSSEKSSDVNPEKTMDKPSEIAEVTSSTVANSDEIMAAYVKSGNPEEVMRMYAEKRQARAELLQRQMDAENLDTNWADELAKKFANLHRVLPGIKGVSLTATDCRQSICALHLDFSQADDYQRLAPMIANAGNVLGSDAFVHHDAKPQGAVMYLSREDHILPDMEMLDQG